MAFFLLLAGNAEAGDAPAAVLLRLKATEAPYPVETVTVFETIETGWDGVVKTGTSEVLTAFERMVREPRPGLLMVMRKVRGPDGTFSLVVTPMDPQGRVLQGAVEKTAASRDSIRFPDEPVSEGSVWTYPQEPSDGCPVGIPVRCRVLRLERTQAGLKAQLRMEYDATVPYPGDLCSGTVASTSTLVVDVARGIVERSESRSTSTLTYRTTVPDRPRETTVVTRARSALVTQGSGRAPTGVSTRADG